MDIDWGDADIEWTQHGALAPVEVLRQLFGAAATGVARDELRVPMWGEGSFSAGRLTREQHLRFWDEVILVGHPRREFILENMRGMRPSRYFQHFKGRFMGQDYDCATPPSRQFENHWPPGLTSTGQDPEQWAFEKVQKDVATGAIRCLGKVGEVAPPHIVLPLGVEMDKPRLMTDARFTNLWGDPGSFRLDSVGQVPETFRRDGAFCNYDHKSGYRHFMFEEEEQGYFGFCIRGHYYVFAAGCFGWSKMPGIYHLTHVALMQFTQRVYAIPSLCYLDGGLTGTLFAERGDAQWIEGSAARAALVQERGRLDQAV